jgi:DNA-binding response OmpR family regulator
MVKHDGMSTSIHCIRKSFHFIECRKIFLTLAKIFLSKLDILVIEDEKGLRDSVVSYLSAEDNFCTGCDSLSTAIATLSKTAFDCILLDIGLPDGDGLKVLSYLKSNMRNEAVIVISAKRTISEKIEGLNFGADDYLSKPFHLAEINARIMAIHRRKQNNFTHIVKYNELSINIIHREIYVNSVVLVVTKKEFDILLYFLVNKGKIISKNALAEHLWLDEIDLHSNLDFIYTHIKNLRKKLTDAGCADYFKTIYAIGYKFDNQ